MKRRSLFFASLLFGAAATATAVAQDTRLDDLLRESVVKQPREKSGDAAAPVLDPKRIVNESNNFLKEREPEMTAEEYALYERVVAMINAKPEFALKLLQAMVKEGELPSPAFEFILGNVYYAIQDHAQAEARYRSAVKRYPNFLRAWSNLGLVYYTTGRYAEAIACFSKCVALGDRDPLTFGLLGFSLEQQKLVVQAEVAYSQALSGAPNNSDWLEGLLRIYMDGKQYGRAEWLVKDLIKQKPAESRFWLAYANIQLAQNRKLEAIALLESCLSLGVAGSNELNLLGDLYADQRLVPEAIAIYERILTDTPKVAEKKLLTFAELLNHAGNQAGSRRVLDALGAKVSPAGRGAYLLARADLLVAERKWTEARTTLEDLLKGEPLNGRGLIALGRTYVADENLPRAQLAFEAALQVQDSAYRACLELATLELKNRHYNKTVDYLERALAIQKTAPVEDFLARVKPLLTASTDTP